MTDLALSSAEPSGETDQISAIDKALAVGDVELVHRIAESRPDLGSSDAEADFDSKVALRLAWCDLLMSRVKRARAGAARAATLFEARADLANEIDAHALHARTASRLGHSVEAVESALLATRLAEEMPAGLWTARAHLSLGIAFGWGHSFAQAERAFETASQVAARHGDIAAQAEVAVERDWVRAIRWLVERQGQTQWPYPDGSYEPHRVSRRPVGLSQTELA